MCIVAVRQGLPWHFVPADTRHDFKAEARQCCCERIGIRFVRSAGQIDNHDFFELYLFHLSIPSTTEREECKRTPSVSLRMSFRFPDLTPEA
jgi:hypothetical protein